MVEQYCRSQEPGFWSGVDAWHFHKGMAGMDPETNTSNHVEQISFRQCVTFCEHRQLKGWQPRFQTTVAKSSISTMTMFIALQQSSSTTDSTIRRLIETLLGDLRLNDQTLCFSADDSFFLLAATKA